MRLRKLLFATYSVTLALSVVQQAQAQQAAVAPAALVVTNDRKDAPGSIVLGNATYKTAEAPAALAKYLGLNPATDELRLKGTDAASKEVSIARYTQFYKGVKVAYGSYIVASKNGVISYMSGNFYKPDYAVNTTPQLSEAAALQKALEHTGAQQYIWQIPGADAQLQRELGDPTASYAPKGELQLIEDYSGAEPDGRLHLAYHFDIYATRPLSRNDVFVDAATGRILFTNAIIKHVTGHGNSMYSGPVSFGAAKINNIYSLHDSTRGNGIHTYSLGDSTDIAYRTEITSASDSFAAGVALDAHWGAEKVYDYWVTQRGRLSWNGNNGALYSYVDYDKNYNNAFWSGSAMFYGNGTGRNSGGFDPLVSLDICGHEIGHGVCQSTAGLVYSRESGGMNEGFSDIWGSVIENYANPHEVDATAKSRWLIGEEIAATPLRDMSNPQPHGDPDTYGGAHWKFATSSCSPNSTTNDNCGVHSNSGVLNKWFYLLSDGGTGTNDVNNSYAVPGIGIDTAAQIAWGTELSLTQTANYAACRTASINYATTQFGACSKAVEAVTRAWYAVNVGADYTPACDPQVSFATPVITVDENAASGDCAGSHTITVPVVLNGTTPAGGMAVVKVAVTGGTAVNGVDYIIPVDSVSFLAGSSTAQLLSITVFDNGNTLDTGKYIDLALTVNAQGSNIAAARVLTTTRVKISNDDLAPVAGTTETRTIGTYDVSSNTTSPFQSNTAQAHIQYIITKQELLAGGVKPGATLTKMAFTVISKASTQPYTDFTVKLAPTQENIFTTAFIPTSSFTTVYNSNLTTVSGTNTLTFTNGYLWDGAGNLAVEICFGNTSRANANDQVQGSSASGNRVAYAYSNTNTTGGCTLPFSSANVANARPIIRFTQDVPPTPIATVTGATRKWDMHDSDRTYFYDESDGKLIAGIWNKTNELGCVTAEITQQGNGFTPFGNVNRSVKELRITPMQNDTASYDGLFYLTNDELNGTSAANLQIVRTTAATDADINSGNTQIVSALARTTGLNYRAFRGAFTGFGRFFFVDGMPNLAVSNVPAHSGNSMYVVNNPFRDELTLGYTSAQAQAAEIKLLDVTGKVVYSASRPLASGHGQLSLPVGSLGLAPGNYIVQVICPTEVFTSKVLKQ